MSSLPFVYECEFGIKFDGVYYHLRNSILTINVPNRYIADRLVSELFSDNDYFLGAKYVGNIFVNDYYNQC